MPLICCTRAIYRKVASNLRYRRLCKSLWNSKTHDYHAADNNEQCDLKHTETSRKTFLEAKSIFISIIWIF